MRLTKAQVRFIDRWLHVQDYWLGKTGRIMACNPETMREAMSMGALIQKGAINENGEFTSACRQRYKAIKNYQEKRKSREQNRREQLVAAAGGSPSQGS